MTRDEKLRLRPNRAKEVLREGGVIFSSSVRLPEPALCEILGLAGFDFVLIDGEHGAIDAASIEALVLGCHAGDTVPVFRVLRPHDPEAVMHALDLGVQGVLVPHCRTPDDALALKQAALYPPLGKRGFGPGRGMRWGRVPTAEYFRTVNESVLLLALIEDPEALDHLDEIAAVGLDVLWLGTGDLSLAWGVPGERNDPRILDAAERLVAACRRQGVAAGFPAVDAEHAKWALEQGFRAIGYGGAEQYVMKTARTFLDHVAKPV
ncbi:MAG: hypothetical protein KY476_20985 [Planctomycetes bacterium]|nr:hypothetical protein [Planctomycetota bacterium]